MLFLGYGFCKAYHTADITPTKMTTIIFVRVQNCIIDTLYATKNATDKTGVTIPPVSAWDFDTKLNAQFNGNLLGGNVDFTADQVQSIRIKRAEVNSYKWLTLFEIPIDTNEDLEFTRIDGLARGEQEYKYALVPVWNDNIEGNYNINTVKSDFEGIWIVEKDMAINAFLNLTLQTKQNIIAATITSLGRKYPYVNQYGNTNYTSGSFDVTFINAVISGVKWDLDNAVKYREIVERFLTNGNPKIIKHFDGRIWLACISDSIQKNENTYYAMPIQTISFTEVGQYDSSIDLYNANLIDVNVEGENNNGVLSYSI